MTTDETARLMAQAVLDGDQVAACQLADWLIDGYGRPALPLPPEKKLLTDCGLSKYMLQAVLFRVAWRVEPHLGYHLRGRQRRRTFTVADLASFCKSGDFRSDKTLAVVRTLLARYGLRLKDDAPAPAAPPE